MIIQKISKTQNNNTDFHITHHLKFSQYSNPNIYSTMYKHFPESIHSICDLINKQLVHIGDEKLVKETFSKEIISEDMKLKTVTDILKELDKRNSKGLCLDRLPNERLVATCRNFALFLTSILKHRNIPSRVRAGFVPFQDKFFDHWTCEYWSQNENKWIIIDADKRFYEFPKELFQNSGEAWLQTRDNLVSPERYFLNNEWNGMNYIKENLICDFLCVIGEEVWYDPNTPLSNKSYSSLDTHELTLIDNVANLLKHPDDNLIELLNIYQQNTSFHPIQ